ncbi:L-tyrosine/L-tryptophan isonitrile synthase family protein [Streptomyces sp. SudanB182_2057]|uniref:L-tyrosine/L-tryptophan isonitrile synthase family protein n=1 Tax=Streptomyces sp. SudanB182_2057 TaxID=3035281 RepID=UPI003F577BA7
MTASSPERIVSDSGLPALLRHQPHAALRTPYAFPSGSGPVLDAETLREHLLPRWREGVEKQTKALVRRVRSTMEVLSGDALYSALDDPLSRRAALVAELFRTHTLVKNAGRLDVRALQRTLAGALSTEGPLHFEIAWGHVKRDLAGLKTPGPCADLAEALAIGRLTALTRAASRLLDGEARLTVLSGGTRFQDALLTRSEQLVAYDTQRRQVAEALGAAGAVTFRDFASVRAERDGDRTGRRETYRRKQAEIRDGQIRARLHTVAFNVDWENVLALAADGAAPHGVTLSAPLADWLASAPAERGPLLIRAAATCLVDPGAQPLWAEQFAAVEDGEELLEEGIAFFAHVAWEATRRYIAIHEADKEAAAAGPSADPAPAGTAARPIRLTVHEKRDRPAMPALAVLGMRAPELLPQHLAVLLPGSGGPEFGTVAELHARVPSARPLHLADGAGTQPVFGWLASTSQPLCLVAPEADWQRDLGAVLDPGRG